MTVISYNVRGLLRVTQRETVGQRSVDPDLFRFARIVGAKAAEQHADFVLLQEICGVQAAMIAEVSRDRGHPLHLVAVDEFAEGPDSNDVDRLRVEEARRLCHSDE